MVGGLIGEIALRDRLMQRRGTERIQAAVTPACDKTSCDKNLHHKPRDR
jgi:hypothetical protein